MVLRQLARYFRANAVGCAGNDDDLQVAGYGSIHKAETFGSGMRAGLETSPQLIGEHDYQLRIAI